MKKHTFFASTLFAAATILAVPALAAEQSGSGTSDDPYVYSYETGDTGTSITSANSTYYKIEASGSVTIASVAIGQNSQVEFASGDTTVSTLQFNGSGASYTCYLLVDEGASLTVNGWNTRSGNVSISVAGTLTINSAIAWTNVGAASTITGSGTININSTITKSGAGAITLSADNLYISALTNTGSGAVTISGGTTTIGDYADNSGSTKGTGSTTIASGATLKLTGTSSITNTTITNSGTLISTGTTSIATLTAGSNVSANFNIEGGTTTVTTLNTAPGSGTTYTTTINVSEGAELNVTTWNSRSGLVVLNIDGTMTVTNSIGWSGVGVATTFDGSGTLNLTTGLVVGSGAYNFYTSNINIGTLTTSTGTINIGDGSENNSYTKISTLTLSTAETFNVKSGSTLELSGTATISAGTITVDSGATLVLSGTTTISGGTQTYSGDVTISGTVTLSSALSVSGTLTVTDTAVFALDNFTASESDSGTTYTLATAGTLSISENLSTSNFTLNDEAISSRQTVSVSTENSTWTVTFVGTVGDLIWDGSSSTSWTTNTEAQNWKNNGNADCFVTLDNVTFDSSSSNKTVSIAEDISAGTITVSDDYTFTSNSAVTVSASSLSGSGKLTLGENVTLDLTSETNSSFSSSITGAGTLKLALATGYSPTVTLDSAFAGTVYITSGTFTMNTSNFGTNSTIELADGVNFQFTSNSTSSNSNNFVFDGTTQVHANSGADATLSGDISGTGTLQKQGAGTLTLSGTLGIASIAANVGTLNISGLGTITTLTVSNSGTTATVSNSDLTISTLTISNGTLNVSSGTVTALTISGGTTNVSGGTVTTLTKDAGVLNVAGGKITTLNFNSTTGALTFTGAATVSQLVFKIGSTTGVYAIVNEGVNVSFGDVNRSTSNICLQVDGTATVSSAFSFTPGYYTEVAGSGTIDFTKGIASGGGNGSWLFSVTNLKTKSISTTNSGSGTFTISSANLYVDTITANKTVALSSDTTISSYTDDGTVAISGTISNAGTLTIGSATTFSGTITNTGTIVVSGTTLEGIATDSSTTAVINDGDITLSDSGQIKSSDGASVTISSNVTIVLDSYLSDSYDTDGVATVSETETTYAFSGAVTLSGTVTLSATNDFLAEIAEGKTYEFAIATGDVAGTLSVDSFTLDSGLLDVLVSYSYTTSYSDGIYKISIESTSSIPEPSLFGIFAGIAALAIAGTRRRRAKRA